MKWLRVLLIGGLIGLGASTFVKVSSADPNTCHAAYRHDTRIKIGDNYVYAEVPADEPQKEKGLGLRSCIGSEQGMLFVFDKPDSYGFWMKDMKFPIDIVWVNEHKIVVGINTNVAPSTYPNTFTNKKPVQYVLELHAGRAQQLNITEGTSLQFEL